MARAVYDPRWLQCHTPQGPIKALAFTLSRKSPSFCGILPPQKYQQIFSTSKGIYGTTREYALNTYSSLKSMGIHDRSLEMVLRMGNAWDASSERPG